MKAKVDIRPTKFSRPGRPEFEVFAPDGFNLGGPHSLIVRDTFDTAVAEALATPLEKCAPGCDCGWDE